MFVHVYQLNGVLYGCLKLCLFHKDKHISDKGIVSSPTDMCLHVTQKEVWGGH